MNLKYGIVILIYFFMVNLCFADNVQQSGAVTVENQKEYGIKIVVEGGNVEYDEANNVYSVDEDAEITLKLASTDQENFNAATGNRQGGFQMDGDKVPDTGANVYDNSAKSSAPSAADEYCFSESNNQGEWICDSKKIEWKVDTGHEPSGLAPLRETEDKGSGEDKVSITHTFNTPSKPTDDGYYVAYVKATYVVHFEGDLCKSEEAPSESTDTGGDTTTTTEDDNDVLSNPEYIQLAQLDGIMDTVSSFTGSGSSSTGGGNSTSGEGSGESSEPTYQWDSGGHKFVGKKYTVITEGYAFIAVRDITPPNKIEITDERGNEYGTGGDSAIYATTGDRIPEFNTLKAGAAGVPNNPEKLILRIIDNNPYAEEQWASEFTKYDVAKYKLHVFYEVVVSDKAEDFKPLNYMIKTGDTLEAVSKELCGEQADWHNIIFTNYSKCGLVVPPEQTSPNAFSTFILDLKSDAVSVVSGEYYMFPVKANEDPNRLGLKDPQPRHFKYEWQYGGTFGWDRITEITPSPNGGSDGAGEIHYIMEIPVTVENFTETPFSKQMSMFYANNSSGPPAGGPWDKEGDYFITGWAAHGPLKICFMIEDTSGNKLPGAEGENPKVIAGENEDAPPYIPKPELLLDKAGDSGACFASGGDGGIAIPYVPLMIYDDDAPAARIVINNSVNQIPLTFGSMSNFEDKSPQWPNPEAPKGGEPHFYPVTISEDQRLQFEIYAHDNINPYETANYGIKTPRQMAGNTHSPFQTWEVSDPGASASPMPITGATRVFPYYTYKNPDPSYDGNYYVAFYVEDTSPFKTEPNKRIVKVYFKTSAFKQVHIDISTLEENLRIRR